MPSGQVVTVFPQKKRRKTGQGNVGDMTEDNHSHSVNVHHPQGAYEQDCNSNCAILLPDPVTTSRLSNVSSNDGDIHDTSDYQWFADFGSKDQQQQQQQQNHHGTTSPLLSTGNNTNHQKLHHPTSIFAVLNSPNLRGDFTYEDLSRNIDVNLAEIDMEDFRSEDINSILALPAMYCGDFQQSQNQGEQAASLSGSIMARFDAFGSSSISHHSTSGESTDMSVCKSEPLFSPVKENAGFPAFSVDSLDCDSYNEQELMLTCQANMNNYTIAFEGSFAKYSDDSDYHEAAGSETTESESWSGQFKVRSSDSIDGSLVQSDFAYTTWSKLKRGNGSEVMEEQAQASSSPTCKSQSLPNLFRKSGTLSDIKISQLNVSTDSEQCVPVYDIQSSQSTNYSRCSDTSSQQSLSLMRLFMQRTGGSSIVHSLSSGALQQMDMYGNGDGPGTNDDTLTSVDERLRCVLNGKLDESGESMHLAEESDLNVHSRQPTTNPLALLPHGKGTELVKNSLKGRRMKAAATNSCKLFSNDGTSEDGPARAGSPLASPIEEEDENDDSSIAEYRKALTDVQTSYNSMDGSASCRTRVMNSFKSPVKTNSRTSVESSPASGHSLGTQTKMLNKTSSQQDSYIGFPYVRSKSVNDSSLTKERGSSDVSSTSSGYKSIRNSTEQLSNNPRRKINLTLSTFKSRGTQIPVHVCDEAIQTSFKGEWLQKVLANCARMRVRDRVVQAGGSGPFEANEKGKKGQAENDGKDAEEKVYICYPNYALPDLAFLRSPDRRKSMSKMFLVPTKPLLSPCSRRGQTTAVNAMENLRRVDLSHIQDWDSLNVLLPQDVRDMLNKLRTTEENEGKNQEDTRSMCEPAAVNKEKQDSRAETPITLKSLASKAQEQLYVYKYDDFDAEEPVSELRAPPPLPKRSISLPQGDSPSTPARVSTKPPLPKGILRRPSTSSERRQVATKRYSMPDFLVLQEQHEKLLNRHIREPPMETCDCFVPNFGQEAYSADKCPLSEELADMLGMTRPACPCCNVSSPHGKLFSSNDTQQFVDASKGGSLENVEKLNSDIKKMCQCGADIKNKKTVSFSTSLQVETNANEAIQGLDMLCNCYRSEQGINKGTKPDGADKDWSSLASDDAPQEFCISPAREYDGSAITIDTSSETNSKHSINIQRKNLVAAVMEAVDALNKHFGQAKDPHCKFILGSGLQTPLTGYKVVHHLCPALFAILNDGLHPEVYNLFGHVGNSVWMVVEAVAQSGNCTKQMSDLVIHVNNEQNLWEKHMKFNAFIFGLLNIRSLDSWFSLLGTCSNILQKHYLSSAFLYSTKYSMKPLFDKLLLSLQTLSLLPFDLDLSLETNLCGRHETQSGCDYHNCLAHFNQEVPCYSWMATLSKSIPVTPWTDDFSKHVVDRRCCRHLEGCAKTGNLGDRSPGQRLRRGYSQDSAIATASSELSNGSTGPTSSGETLNLDKFRSCAECRPNSYSPKLHKRWSCGNFNLDSTLVCSDCNCSLMEDAHLKNPLAVLDDRRNGSKCDGGMHEVPSLYKALKSKEDDEDMLCIHNPLITDLMYGVTKSPCKKEDCEDVRQEAEKGALDATIAEQRSADRDSQNNIKEDDDDEDGAKFKELQLRWEILSCAASEKKKPSIANPRSKIPRLVTTPSRSGSRMDDSAVSVRTSASGTISPDGCNFKVNISDGDSVTAVETKAKTRMSSEPNRYVNSGRPNTNLKVPAGQPTVVVKTSADRSPIRKRAPQSPRKLSVSPATKPRQSVSRGVGGPE